MRAKITRSCTTKENVGHDAYTTAIQPSGLLQFYGKPLRTFTVLSVRLHRRYTLMIMMMTSHGRRSLIQAVVLGHNS